MHYITAAVALLLALLPSWAAAHDEGGHERPTALEVAAGVQGCLGPFGNALTVHGDARTATIEAGGLPFLAIGRGAGAVGRGAGPWGSDPKSLYVMPGDPLDPPMVLTLTGVNTSFGREAGGMHGRVLTCYDHEYTHLLNGRAAASPLTPVP